MVGMCDGGQIDRKIQERLLQKWRDEQPTRRDTIIGWTLGIILLVAILGFAIALAMDGNGGNGVHCANVDVGAHGQAVCSD